MLSYACTGPVARSGGIRRDLRSSQTFSYSNYWYISFQSFLGKQGDSYDRFLIRVREMYESITICFQILSNLTPFSASRNLFLEKISKNSILDKNQTKTSSMESLINHFKDYSEGIKLPYGRTYGAVEAPKGEFAVYFITNNTQKPYRSKARPPAYHHMNSIAPMGEGHLFADLITILGSQDIVFGDVDR